MINQKERISEFMRLMTQASKKTGITYAVQHGEPLIVFDLSNNEPVNLEIIVGTEVKKENGQTSITTFDKSNVSN